MTKNLSMESIFDSWRIADRTAQSYTTWIKMKKKILQKNIKILIESRNQNTWDLSSIFSLCMESIVDVADWTTQSWKHGSKELLFYSKWIKASAFWRLRVLTSIDITIGFPHHFCKGPCCITSSSSAAMSTLEDRFHAWRKDQTQNDWWCLKFKTTMYSL